MRRAGLLAVAALAGCGTAPGDLPEVKACEAFTLGQLRDPDSYRRTSATIFDRDVNDAEYARRAGYADAPAAVRTIGRELLRAYVEGARSEGGAGEVGIRSVLLRFDGGGAGGSRVVPVGTNVCEFTTIDGAISSHDDLAYRVERANSTLRLDALRDLSGAKNVPIADPMIPCCLVP